MLVTVIITPVFIVTVSVAAGMPAVPVQPDHLVPSPQLPVVTALHAASEAICQERPSLHVSWPLSLGTKV